MNKTILLIEDLPVIQKLYGDTLAKHDFDVDVARDGREALEDTKIKQYDYVLLDLLLPNVNGIEFLEKFTDRPEQTKIFVLSDFTEPATHDRAMQLGVTEYLVKAETTPYQLIDKLNSYSDDQEDQNRRAVIFN